MRSVASVPTAHASRYLQQLCKHWSHKMDVAFDAEEGRIDFPNGTRTLLTAADDALTVTVEVPDGEDPARMQQVVADHLDRFAFREAPLPFEWRPG